MLGKNLILLLASFLGLWLVLGIERVVGLPSLFIFGWLLLASQLRLRMKFFGSLINSLLIAAVYGVGWHWAFLILWLGAWLTTPIQIAPLIKWWRMLGWSLAGAWLIGGLSQLTLGVSYNLLAWVWPIFWLSLLLFLKLRRLF